MKLTPDGMKEAITLVYNVTSFGNGLKRRSVCCEVQTRDSRVNTLYCGERGKKNT